MISAHVQVGDWSASIGFDSPRFWWVGFSGVWRGEYISYDWVRREGAA